MHAQYLVSLYLYVTSTEVLELIPLPPRNYASNHVLGTGYNIIYGIAGVRYLLLFLCLNFLEV